LESQISNLSSQDKSTIQRLEQEIKELKKRLEDNKPNENPKPSNKKEGKFIFYGDSLEKSGYGKFGGELDNFFLFYISKNHPRIKELLSKGKLQENKQFLIRYGKADEISEKGSVYTFKKNNQELEIVEV
jgi:hypothetical protein